MAVSGRRSDDIFGGNFGKGKKFGDFIPGAVLAIRGDDTWGCVLSKGVVCC